MLLRTLVLVVVAILSMPISAGPVEDARTAHEKGDFATAARLWRALAEQGNVYAQAILGIMYAEGQGVPQNDAEAVKWYRKAADQGFDDAQIKLGIMYANGQGVLQDDAEAVRWFRKAADQGHASAQYNLGSMFRTGRGVPQDYAETAKWYRKAADQGDASAQFNLGLMYDNGHGVPRDYAEAVRWYRKAADQGDAGAQFNLGIMYANGYGVVQNYVLAHMWFNVASAMQENEDVARKRARDSRDRVAKKMTAQQIAQAQTLAAEWQPKSSEPKYRISDVPLDLPPDEVKVVSTGTGFFVSQKGLVLTNHHVIENCASVRLRPTGMPIAPAFTVARDPNNDLALLKSESRPAGVAFFSSRKRPQLGQSAIIFGFPLSGVLSSSGNLTTGTVSALSGLQDDSRLFQISAPVQPGNSGAPVMDSSGAIIGVVVSKLNARAVEKVTTDIPQNVNFAIKGALAEAFLDNNGVDHVTDSGNQQIPVEEIAKRATRFTVLVECLK